MALKEFMEIIEQLVRGQVVDPIVEIVADPPDCPSVGLDCLRLQARQFQALQMLVVILVELRITGHGGVHCNLLVEVIKPMANALALPRLGVYKKRVKLQSVDFRERVWTNCLRVAASSNNENQKLCFNVH
jgi:hypothetical protein